MSEASPATSSRLKQFLIRGGIALGVLFVGIQFVPVAAMENPKSQPALNEKPEVVAILKRSCYDCHSHEVRWPWYSRIAPVSWLVARDVVEGRKGINLSEWPEDKDDQQFNREAIWDSVKDGSMPLWFYLPMHPEAKMSDADKEVIKVWAETPPPEEEEEAEGDKAAEEKEGDEKAGDDAEKPAGSAATEAEEPEDEAPAPQKAGTSKKADTKKSAAKKSAPKKVPAHK
jgi:hypothetical protein